MGWRRGSEVWRGIKRSFVFEQAFCPLPLLHAICHWMIGKDYPAIKGEDPSEIWCKTVRKITVFHIDRGRKFRVSLCWSEKTLFAVNLQAGSLRSRLVYRRAGKYKPINQKLTWKAVLEFTWNRKFTRVLSILDIHSTRHTPYIWTSDEYDPIIVLNLLCNAFLPVFSGWPVCRYQTYFF